MKHGPALRLPRDDSGRTIRLTGDFLWWQGSKPQVVQGEYGVHRDSVERGAKVERWTVGEATWEAVTPAAWIISARRR